MLGCHVHSHAQLHEKADETFDVTSERRRWMNRPSWQRRTRRTANSINT